MLRVVSGSLRPWLTSVRGCSGMLHDCSSGIIGCRHRIPLNTVVCRWYLSDQVAGIKAWKAAREKNQERRVNFEELCSKTIYKLETHRRAKCSDVFKIYDYCTTEDHLSAAENVLSSFRRGLNKPRVGLPLVVVRACVRVGNPQKALDYVTDKLHFGLFPSRRVYNILMDALLMAKDAKGAVSAYEQMLLDEVEPDHTTLYLAAVAHASLGTPEGVDGALKLSEECSARAAGMKRKAKKGVVSALIKQEQVEMALEVLDQLQQEQGLGNQALLNWRFAALMAGGHTHRAVSLLKELCNDNPPPHLARVLVYEWVWESLWQASAMSGDESLQSSVKKLMEELQSCQKVIKALLIPNNQTVATPSQPTGC